MTTLTGSDFNLIYDTLIQARVYAINSKGTGSASATLTSGAQVRTVPTAPAIPFRGDFTDEVMIQVNWTALSTAAETGNSAILSYRLYWDNQGGTTSYYLMDSLTTSFNVTGLFPHLAYKFKV